MAGTTGIRMAHYFSKGLFTVITCEEWSHYRNGVQRDNKHISSAETLEAAKKLAIDKLHDDFTRHGLAMPPIADAGKVARIKAENLFF